MHATQKTADRSVGAVRPTQMTAGHTPEVSAVVSRRGSGLPAALRSLF
jgi:hypothetical protein